jgi:hypothetical protein
VSKDSQEQQDMVFLMGRPEFRRHLLTIIRASAIHASAYGSDGRNLPYSEGRRSLGLDILRDAARAMPVDDPDSAFSLTLLQILREEAQPQEKPDARRISGRAAGASPDGDNGDEFDRR